jgi:hypothetical protein
VITERKSLCDDYGSAGHSMVFDCGASVSAIGRRPTRLAALRV